MGYGRMAHQLADLFDAINVNTRVSGQWKKGATPDFPAAYRPSSSPAAAAASPSRVSVKQLYKRFTTGGP